MYVENISKLCTTYDVLNKQGDIQKKHDDYNENEKPAKGTAGGDLKNNAKVLAMTVPRETLTG